MSRNKKIIIDIDICSAMEVYDVLLESQKGYSHEHCPARILNIREVMKKIKDKIDNNCSCKKVNSQSDCPPGTVFINGECADF